MKLFASSADSARPSSDDTKHWTLLVLVLLLLLAQAGSPLWEMHMSVDVTVFHARAYHFMTNGTWAGMEYNEYMPGALWFFVFVGWLTNNIQSYDAFATSLFLTNCGLIVGHFLFFRKHGPSYAVPAFLLLTAAIGPILLFRFELLTSLLTLFSWQRFREGKLPNAAAYLGVAVCVKLYPVILLPLLLASTLREKKWTETFTTLLWFCNALALPAIAVMLMGGTLADIVRSISVHGLKPIGLEGFWGNLVTIIQGALGIPVIPHGDYGIAGMLSSLPVLHDPFLNYSWVIPVGVVTLWAILRDGGRRLTDPLAAYLIVFLFVYLAKTVNPQYLWWFAVFLPLVSFDRVSESVRTQITYATAFCLMITQIYYPLYYTEFLQWFEGTYASPFLFELVVFRNVLLLVILGIGLYCFTPNTGKSQKIKTGKLTLPRTHKKTAG